MRKQIIGAGLMLLALSGCAGTNPASTPTPTIDANAGACDDFESATLRTVDLAARAWSDTETLTSAEEDELAGMGATVDTIALSASGATGGRIEDVADYLLDLASPVVILMEHDEWDSRLEAVERACSAAGHEIEAFTIGEILNGG